MCHLAGTGSDGISWGMAPAAAAPGDGKWGVPRLSRASAFAPPLPPQPLLFPAPAALGPLFPWHRFPGAVGKQSREKFLPHHPFGANCRRCDVSPMRFSLEWLREQGPELADVRPERAPLPHPAWIYLFPPSFPARLPNLTAPGN